MKTNEGVQFSAQKLECVIYLAQISEQAQNWLL